MSNTEILFVYIPCRDMTEAEKIGQALVEARLAACANLFPQMTSIYHWQGKLERSSEAVLILKTTRAAFKAAAERVRSLHSYEVPCIAALEVSSINEAYLGWLTQQTGE